MKYLLVFSAFCILAFASCGNNEKPVETTVKSASKPTTSNLNDTGTHLLTLLVSRYYDVKNGLVATNHVKTADVANTAAAARKMCIAADSLKDFFQKSNKADLGAFVTTIITEGAAIAQATDTAVEDQRLHFSKITAPFYSLLQQTGVKNANIYKQHCPMAFNDKGADWLSNEEEIKNPYYGKKMLECGDVTDSLK